MKLTCSPSPFPFLGRWAEFDGLERKFRRGAGKRAVESISKSEKLITALFDNFVPYRALIWYKEAQIPFHLFCFRI